MTGSAGRRVRRRIQSTLLLDKTQGRALLTKLWQALSGPVTITLILTLLSVDEQAVYYSLVSIIALQNFFELGLSNLLVSHAGREQPAYQSSKNEVANQARHRLASLHRGATQWFAAATLGFMSLALVVGYVSFTGVTESVAWQLPMLTIIPLAGGIVFLLPKLAILEGLGHRSTIYRMRLWQMVLGSLAVWATLTMNGKLWCLASATAVQLLASLVVVVLLRHDLPSSSKKNQPLNPSPLTTRATTPSPESNPKPLLWRRDVLPGQWRLGVIAITQHAATQLFTIILLNFDSESAAAAMGMVQSIASPLQMLALTWLQTNLSVASSLHGSGERERAGTLWRRAAIASCGFLICGLVALIMILAGLLWWRPELSPRFLNPGQAALLFGSYLANHVVAIQGFYVVSRFSRPIFGPAVIGLFACGLGSWIGVYLAGLNGLLWGYLIVSLAIFLPLHTRAYLRTR
ncbi:MAG: hypothetical protein AAF745_02265 [Planctomycetota bacterium]